MVDIVERLRDLDKKTANPPFWTTGICGEAADEIDRLRAALNTARITDNYESARSAALSQIWALMGVADHESALSRLAKLEAVAEAGRAFRDKYELDGSDANGVGVLLHEFFASLSALDDVLPVFREEPAAVVDD